MTLNLNASMAEVTRLTREGRLAEAMARLQGLPQKSKSPEAQEGLDRRMRMAPLDRLFIDMVPPRSGSGHWTAPSFDAHHGSDTAPTEGLPPLHVPKAMRGFLAHLGKLGSSPGPRGKAASLPDGARFEEYTFTNQAGSRTYKLYIPSRYRGEPLPLVVMLHGCTQSPDDFAAGTQMNELAEEQGLLVKPSKRPAMRNSLSGSRGKPPWKPSGRPLATPAMPPAKLGSEKADRSSVDRSTKDAVADLPAFST
jgi:hypothetical protein